MSLIDTIKRSLRPAPLPVSALIAEMRMDAAIDSVIDAAEAQPRPVRPASGAGSKRSRQLIDSQSTLPPTLPPTLAPARPPAPVDSQSKPTESQSAPPRARSGTKPKPRRKGAKAVLKPEEILIGVRSHAVSARDHALALLDYLLNEAGCPPGGEAMPATLERIYRWEICEPRGWHPISWRGANGIGRHLRELCGGRKHNKDVPNADRELPDGRIVRTYSKRRVYVLPRWEDVPGAGPAGSASVTPFPRSRGARGRAA